MRDTPDIGLNLHLGWPDRVAAMTNHRFAALDGLRGICALIVVLYHTFRLQAVSPFAHGYLSVDVFFVLSGFVLAYAFGARLEGRAFPKRYSILRLSKVRKTEGVSHSRHDLSRA